MKLLIIHSWYLKARLAWFIRKILTAFQWFVVFLLKDKEKQGPKLLRARFSGTRTCGEFLHSMHFIKIAMHYFVFFIFIDTEVNLLGIIILFSNEALSGYWSSSFDFIIKSYWRLIYWWTCGKRSQCQPSVRAWMNESVYVCMFVCVWCLYTKIWTYGRMMQEFRVLV